MSDVTTSEMAESPPSSSLLTIPAGVENVLLSFVSSGDGGLQRILNLRQVCKETKSWVDNLPKRQADIVFARTQVAMDCNEQTLRRFLTSPPPFGVTALSLQADALRKPTKKPVDDEEVSEEEEASSEEEEMSLNTKARLKVALASLEEANASLKKIKAAVVDAKLSLEKTKRSPKETQAWSEDEASLEDEDLFVEEATWRSFCAFWNSKLKTLKLSTRRGSEVPFNHLLLELLESPKLLRLQLCRGLVLLRDESLTPSFFGKVRELRAEAIYPGESFRNEFFAQLENNSNLAVLSVSPGCEEDFLGFTEVVQRKTNDTRLQVTFDLVTSTVIRNANYDPFIDYNLHRRSRAVFAMFAASIVASKSQIHLKLSDMEYFDHLMTQLLPRDDCEQFFTKVVYVKNWTPTEESLSLMECLSQLKTLESVDTEDEDSSVDFDRLTFPPSLEVLGFTSGFPARQRLPESLTSLVLHNYECDVESLVSSLKFLCGRCPELNTLRISWKCTKEKSPPLKNFEAASAPFSKLKKLSFTGRIGMAQVAGIRTALVNGFDWRRLKLNFLQLSSADLRGRRQFSVVSRQLKRLVLNPKMVTLVNDVVCLWRVGEEILRNLCEGSSAKSLLTIEVANEWVTPEGLAQLEKLRSLASANWKEREERMGRGGAWRQRYDPLSD